MYGKLHLSSLLFILHPRWLVFTLSLFEQLASLDLVSIRHLSHLFSLCLSTLCLALSTLFYPRAFLLYYIWRSYVKSSTSFSRDQHFQSFFQIQYRFVCCMQWQTGFQSSLVLHTFNFQGMMLASLVLVSPWWGAFGERLRGYTRDDPKRIQQGGQGSEGSLRLCVSDSETFDTNKLFLWLYHCLV